MTEEQTAPDVADGADNCKKTARRRWPLVTALVVLFALFTAGGAAAGATIGYADSLSGRLLPGTTIAGLDVGGQTGDEALETVQDALSDQLSRRIVVRWQGQRWQTKARKLGAHTNARDIIAEVAASQQGLTWQDWARLRWLGDRADTSAVVDVDYRRRAVRRFIASIADELDLEPTDATMSVDGREISIGPSAVGYQVRRRNAVDALLDSLRGDGGAVSLRVRTLQPEVLEEAFAQVLLLDQSDHRLTLFLDGVRASQWIVATGTGDYPTPPGQYHVELKRYMPTWVNPAPDGWGKDMPDSIPPGPKNPLGVRALNWNAPAIRFHGTQAIDSLGTDASHGCVRMSNKDVIELYDLVDVGAVIVSQS
ncbi:MAG: L,D-transpeptidase family protein [Nitriliruptorales bacterium]|nr:L,D-transpeptidase family protein [Nitriliruptorales bacterium]